MPNEVFSCPSEETTALKWFLDGIANEALSMQVTIFILLALESNSDKELKLVLIRFLRWLASFDKTIRKTEDKKTLQEVKILLRKLYVECLVFCVPFFWPDSSFHKGIRAELSNRKSVLQL